MYMMRDYERVEHLVAKENKLYAMEGDSETHCEEVGTILEPFFEEPVRITVDHQRLNEVCNPVLTAYRFDPKMGKQGPPFEIVVQWETALDLPLEERTG